MKSAHTTHATACGGVKSRFKRGSNATGTRRLMALKRMDSTCSAPHPPSTARNVACRNEFLLRVFAPALAAGVAGGGGTALPAVVVASFLPYTQFRRANIIVDFFTTGTSEKTQSRLDALGTLLYTLVLGLVAWRVAVGGVDIKASQETSMLMALPLWIPYLLMVPGLALCSVIGFVQTLQHLGLIAKEEV